MTQEAPPEIIDLALVSCEACDQLFLHSPRRQTCPTCGGSPGLYFFEFQGGPDGLVLLGHPELASATPQAPAEAPAPAEPPPEPEPVAVVRELEGELSALDLARSRVALYLEGEDISEDDLLQGILDAGAEGDEAGTAVGRLIAVRALFRRLEVQEPTE